MLKKRLTLYLGRTGCPRDAGNGRNDVYRSNAAPFSPRCLTTLHYKRGTQRQRKLIINVIFSHSVQQSSIVGCFCNFVSVFDKIWDTELTFNKAWKPHSLSAPPKFTAERRKYIWNGKLLSPPPFYNAENEGHKVLLVATMEIINLYLIFLSLGATITLLHVDCLISSDGGTNWF